MKSLEELLEQWLRDIAQYSKKLHRTEVYGLIISTAWTPDCGFETAIIDKNGIYVVERYKNEKESTKGHKKWCEEAKTIKKVKELNFLDVTIEDEVELERDFDVNFPEKHGMNIFKSYKHVGI